MKKVFAAYRSDGGFSDGKYLVGLFSSYEEAVKVAGTPYDTTQKQRATHVREMTIYDTALAWHEKNGK
jgi:hypothetical protein